MRLHPWLTAALTAGGSLAASAQTNLTLHDAARGRDIPIKVYYPSPNHAAGPLPLIVFSHGFGGNKNDYRYLGKGWSQAGYIVILPTHANSDRAAISIAAFKKAKDGSLRLTCKSSGPETSRTCFPRWIRSNAKFPPSRDESTCCTSASRTFRRRGHGFADGRNDVTLPGGSPQSFRDPRVSAVIAMSPQGGGEQGFNDHSWENAADTGYDDERHQGYRADWRREAGVAVEAFQRMPPGNKYHVLLDGAVHLSFAIAGPGYRSCLLSVTTAFWDTYLKDDKSAESRIASAGPCMVSRK